VGTEKFRVRRSAIHPGRPVPRIVNGSLYRVQFAGMGFGKTAKVAMIAIIIMVMDATPVAALN
jgi:hypothetical protein